jgi:Family of unknown function (DUF6326)
MTDRNKTRDDPKVNVKVVLSGLWVSMLFVFAYVDIFGFWRTDVINGALDGKVPGGGFDIDQAFLALTTLYILIPSLMVSFSLIAPTKVNRPTNLVVSMLYAVSVVASAIGETWAYYILGSVVEVVLLLAIAAVAWFWPSTSHQLARTEMGDATRIHPDYLPRSRQRSKP